MREFTAISACIKKEKNSSKCPKEYFKHIEKQEQTNLRLIKKINIRVEINKMVSKII